ncbi:MAG: hypothetical protein U1F76_26485 [Candidatus Competibacteraceae bacterium]
MNEVPVSLNFNDDEWLVCLLAGFGDCLISLYFLSQIPPERRNFRILGTGWTQEILSLLQLRDIAFDCVFDHIVAFYTVKKSGIWRAGRDLVKFVSLLRQSKAKRIILEIHDFRLRLIRFMTPHAYIHSPERGNVYSKRRELFANVFGVVPSLPDLCLPGDSRRVVIHATSSRMTKDLQECEVRALIDWSKSTNAEPVLIDFDGRFSSLKHYVAEYYLRPPLSQALEILRGCDLFVGVDSFFMHIAYLFSIPFFVYLRCPNSPAYFPPTMGELGNFSVLSPNSSEPEVVVSRLRDFLLYSKSIAKRNLLLTARS